VICSPPLDPGPGKSSSVEFDVNYQPTKPLNLSISIQQSKLRRNDTGVLAFQDNIYSFHGTYQFSRFVFARARIDYDTLSANARGQFLFGYTPNPGTAFYVGYNDDISYNANSPFTGQVEPGLRRNGRTFFIKLSYLFRKSFGG
jgi:predicted porin